MACHTPPLKNSQETRGNAITQPQSHSIHLKNVEFTDEKSPLISELSGSHLGHVLAMAPCSAYNNFLRLYLTRSSSQSEMFWGYMFCIVMKGNYTSIMAQSH